LTRTADLRTQTFTRQGYLGVDGCGIIAGQVGGEKKEDGGHAGGLYRW
jgi:hypothetical protein